MAKRGGARTQKGSAKDAPASELQRGNTRSARCAMTSCLDGMGGEPRFGSANGTWSTVIISEKSSTALKSHSCMTSARRVADVVTLNWHRKLLIRSYNDLEVHESGRNTSLQLASLIGHLWQNHDGPQWLLFDRHPKQTLPRLHAAACWGHGSWLVLVPERTMWTGQLRPVPTALSRQPWP